MWRRTRVKFLSPFATKAGEVDFGDVRLDDVYETCSKRASIDELDALHDYFE